MTDEKKTEKATFYEVGYHLLSTVAQEKIADEAAKIRGMIESRGGVVEQEQTPELRDLAYQITKIFNNKQTRYNSAYFGFITFTLSPEGVVEFKKELDTNENVLRSLIIKTTPQEAKTPFSSKKPLVKKEEVEDGGEVVSEEELDKKIESLIVD